MKKLIALTATAVMASSAAMADVAISGTASVSYDDNGTAASATTYDAGLTFTGSVGTSTLTATYDLEADAMTALDLASTIGPVSVSADMHQTDESNVDDGDGDARADSDDTGVTISTSVPMGGVTLAVDNSGDVTVTGTAAGITVSHTVADLASTTIAASLAGVDVSVTRAESSTTACAATPCAATPVAGTVTASTSTTWSLATSVGGIALTLNSGNDVSATMGLAGNTMVVSHFGADGATAANVDNFSAAAADAYSTVAITRDLTSGATLTATYSSSDDSLTLGAAVAF